MILDILKKVVGTDDVRQSIAWIGTVGIAICISAAVYIRVGQYIEIEEIRDQREAADIEYLKEMIEPWNVVDVKPWDVKDEVLKLRRELELAEQNLSERLNNRQQFLQYIDEVQRLNPELILPDYESLEVLPVPRTSQPIKKE